MKQSVSGTSMIAINVSVAICQLPIRQLSSFGKRSNLRHLLSFPCRETSHMIRLNENFRLIRLEPNKRTIAIIYLVDQIISFTFKIFIIISVRSRKHFFADQDARIIHATCAIIMKTLLMKI